jgi:tetratricopeptide (TPR) repeat protein
VGAAVAPRLTIPEIEVLLSGAQERFRTGDREGAAALLVDAALAYERADRLENAASIFRSLARGPQTSTRLLELWLANCEHRHDSREASEVSCELGDRALNDGDMSTARAWFERACDHDADNAVACRRLSRLAELAAADRAREPAAAIAMAQPAAQPEAEPEVAAGAAAMAPATPETDTNAGAGSEGRVEMSVGRAEAVSFDLGALLSEFQRGIEAQLSGDAQSHYDLAMTYREMGLLTQAVDGFRLAAADPAFTYRAAEMIGRCLLDQGRFEEAVHEFAEALRSPKLAPEAVLGLRYQLGLAHEAAGDLNGAVAEFERVFEQQANYSDVALKLRALRTSLGQA